MIKVGQRLQEERLKKGLSLKDISLNTKIREEFLSAIEKGEYEKLPSVSYVQGFVKNYAKFLDLSESEITALFRREFDEDKVFRVLPKGMPRETDISLSAVRIRQTFIIVGFVFLVVLGYIIFQYRYAFLNPSLKINSPKEMQLISDSSVYIVGSTDPNSTVYVNKDAVSVDENGNFRKMISVFPGKTKVTIKVINKFGKQTTVERNIIVKPSS